MTQKYDLNPIPDDYVPEGFSRLDDGDYTVVGIEWHSVDDNNNPILKTQKNGRVARFFFTVKKSDGNIKGPSHGFFLYEFPMFGKAFGVDLPDPPLDTDAFAVSTYLTTVGEMINSSGNEIAITVKDGWVKRIPSMFVAKGTYNFTVNGVVSVNDETKEKSFFERIPPWGGVQRQVDIAIEIVSGAQGVKSPYQGAKIIIRVPYGLEYLEDKNQIRWELYKDSESMSKDAMRASAMYQLTAPTMFDPFEPDNPRNIVPYWLKHMGEKSGILSGKIDYNVAKDGRKFYQLDFTLVEHCPLSLEMIKQIQGTSVSSPSPQTAPTPAPQEQPTPTDVSTQETTSETSDIDNKARDYLLAFLGHLAGGAILDGTTLNDLGKSVADKYLTPLLEKGEIQPVLLHVAKFDDSVQIIKALMVSDNLTEEQKAEARKTEEKIQLVQIGLDESEPVKTKSDNPWA